MTFQILSDAVDVRPDTSSSGEDFVDLALRTVRQHLDMEVAYLSEFVDGRAIFRAVSAPGLEDMIKAGDSQDLRDIYCQHILDGRLPNVIGDTREEPIAMALPITDAVPIRSHVSVPVHRQDGSVYGMFCCLSPRPNTTLNERDLRVMYTFADLAKRQLHANLDARSVKERAITAITAFLTNRNYTILYQPIFEIGSSIPIGFEALCRFSADPYRPPNEWFDDARGIDRRTDLEIAVIEDAIKALSMLPDPIYLSVNASPATIGSGRLLEVFAAAPISRIVVEVTEHEVITDYDSFQAEIAVLVANGVRIAIDDVGSGYSGLSQILKTQPQLIKLDMDLVRNIDKDTARQSLVRGLAEFSGATRSMLVAEGIETEAELSMLQSLSVDLGQGYLMGRPSNLDAALAWFYPSSCNKIA